MILELANGPRALALHLPRALVVEGLDLDTDAVIGALQARVARARRRAAPHLPHLRHPTHPSGALMWFICFGTSHEQEMYPPPRLNQARLFKRP